MASSSLCTCRRWPDDLRRFVDASQREVRGQSALLPGRHVLGTAVLFPWLTGTVALQPRGIESV